MPHLRGGSRFTQKLFSVGFGEVFFPRNLDRDDAVEFRLAGFPDGSEGSLTQAIQQLEMAELLAVSAVVMTSLDCPWPD